MKSAAVGTQDARLEAIQSLAPAFRARAREADEQAVFPAENFADLRRLGLLSLTAPESLGGHGLWTERAFTPFYEVLEALAFVDTSTAQLLQVHSHALGFLSRHGTPSQYERFLAEIVANGQLLASVGSETAPTGNQPGVYSSELVPDGDGWRLTCSKYFASLAPAADWYLVWVAVPGSEPYPDRTVTVLVPRSAPELTLVDDWDVMGMRPTVSWGVHVEDMHVPAEQVIGPAGAWVRDDPRTFTLAFAANHAGLARAALDFAIEWVRARPYLADSDLVQAALGTLAAQVQGARSAVMAAAATWDAGRWQRAEAESLMAVHLAKRAALDATRQAFDICGARTSFKTFPLEAWYRDARTLTLHVRDDVQMRELGRGLLRDGSSAKAALDTSVLPSRNA
jgi:alkylation response protein AidB-like acyl-CoA dehydrogenase